MFYIKKLVIFRISQQQKLLYTCTVPTNTGKVTVVPVAHIFKTTITTLTAF
jgi:hypothetical protein